MRRTRRARAVVLPAAPRPPDLPPPTPSPVPTADPSADRTPTGTPQPSRRTTAPPDGPLAVRASACRRPIGARRETDLFGADALGRDLVTGGLAGRVEGALEPAMLFPGLGDRGTLPAASLSAAARPHRGARTGRSSRETRDDGTRVYPQEWLAGQTIGYVTPVTAEDVAPAAEPPTTGGRGDGSQRARARGRGAAAGTPGLVLGRCHRSATRWPCCSRTDGPRRQRDHHHPARPAGDRRCGLAGYAEAATAVIDPQSGDVWALASAPLFNPNAMTLGTTLAGQPLATPSGGARLNKAALAAYPAGSSFKSFTLLAALKTGVASPATRMSLQRHLDLLRLHLPQLHGPHRSPASSTCCRRWPSAATRPTCRSRSASGRTSRPSPTWCGEFGFGAVDRDRAPGR